MVIGIIFGMFSVSPYKWLIWTAAEIFVDVIRGIPDDSLAAFIFYRIPNLIESMTGHNPNQLPWKYRSLLQRCCLCCWELFVVDSSRTSRTDGSLVEKPRDFAQDHALKELSCLKQLNWWHPNFVPTNLITEKMRPSRVCVGLVELFQTLVRLSSSQETTKVSRCNAIAVFTSSLRQWHALNNWKGLTNG